MSKAFNWWDGTIYIPKSQNGRDVDGEIFTGHTVQGREVWVHVIQHETDVSFDGNGLSSVAFGSNAYDILHSSVMMYAPFSDNTQLWLQVPCINKDNVGQQIQLVIDTQRQHKIFVRRRGATNDSKIRGYVVYTKRLPTDS